MKKTFSILLLFLFVYQTVGYYVTFKVLQLDIRHRMKDLVEKSLQDNQFEVISFEAGKDNEKLKWTRTGKEFSYKNKMYDVVRKKEENGKVYYFCLNDKKEEELFANLDDFVRKSSENNKNVKNILLKVTNNYFYENTTIEKGRFVFEFISLTKTNRYNNPDKKTTEPPPDFS